MSPPLGIKWNAIAAILGVAALAGCAKPPPPPPPPPPPVVEATPYRPLPPIGAPYQMEIPRRLSPDDWLTINDNLDAEETLWHFRSGWNVAALNCNGADYAPITQGYGDFLKRFERDLSRANSELDREYRDRARNQREGVRLREAHATQVYNYFAMPGARRGFCNAALAIANETMMAPPSDALQLAASGLARYDEAFEQFFGEYAEYQVLSADWDSRYGAQYGASQPGYVAIYGAGMRPGIAASLMGGDPGQAGQVFDPETGAMIPVIAVPEGSISVPVVQPVAEEPEQETQ